LPETVSVVGVARHNSCMPSHSRFAFPQEPGASRLHAFVDESMRLTPDNQGLYLLAAVVCDSAACDSIREMLRSLRYRRQPRLHWHAEESPRQTKIAESIGALGLPTTLVIGMPLAKRKQERARAKCMQALLPELQTQGVDQVWLEARTPSLVRRDMRLVDALRTKRLITPSLRVDTAFPSDEPMLWLPDAVAGAAAASRGGQPEYLALIGPVHQIEVSTL
jgi:hypothetical protein